MQLEIDRSLYLDVALAEPGEGMAGVIEIVSGLVRRLAGEVAALGQVASGRGAQTIRDGRARRNEGRKNHLEASSRWPRFREEVHRSAPIGSSHEGSADPM
jgi:hypothetical protein